MEFEVIPSLPFPSPLVSYPQVLDNNTLRIISPELGPPPKSSRLADRYLGMLMETKGQKAFVGLSEIVDLSRDVILQPESSLLSVSAVTARLIPILFGDSPFLQIVAHQA